SQSQFSDAQTYNQPDSEFDYELADGPVEVVSPLRLMWWKFRRHRVAVASSVFLLIAYFVAIFAGFFAPYTPLRRSNALYAPPQLPRFVDAEGNFHLRPFVYGLTMTRDLETLR